MHGTVKYPYITLTAYFVSGRGFSGTDGYKRVLGLFSVWCLKVSSTVSVVIFSLKHAIHNLKHTHLFRRKEYATLS